jgi:hypothetical protein
VINTSDEDKTTDEEEKAHSITAIWNFEKQNYYLSFSKFQIAVIECAFSSSSVVLSSSLVLIKLPSSARW